MTSSLLERPTFRSSEPLHRTTELHPCRWLTVGEELAPGIWVVPVKRWVSANELDRYHELPPVDVEVEPRRAYGKSWKDKAACHGMDLTMFFGDDPGSRPALRRSVLRNARVVCGACPVSRECLTSALENEERGIWGGTSHRQRKLHLAQIASGVTTIERVVDECHPVTAGQ